MLSDALWIDIKTTVESNCVGNFLHLKARGCDKRLNLLNNKSIFTQNRSSWTEHTRSPHPIRTACVNKYYTICGWLRHYSDYKVKRRMHTSCRVHT